MLCIDNANRPTFKWWLAVSIILCTRHPINNSISSRPSLWYTSTSETAHGLCVRCCVFAQANGKNPNNERKILMVRLRSVLCAIVPGSSRSRRAFNLRLLFFFARSITIRKIRFGPFLFIVCKKNKNNKNASAKNRHSDDELTFECRWTNTKNTKFIYMFACVQWFNFCAILNVFPDFHWLFHLTSFGWTKNTTKIFLLPMNDGRGRYFNFSEPFGMAFEKKNE